MTRIQRVGWSVGQGTPRFLIRVMTLFRPRMSPVLSLMRKLIILMKGVTLNGPLLILRMILWLRRLPLIGFIVVTERLFQNGLMVVSQLTPKSRWWSTQSVTVQPKPARFSVRASRQSPVPLTLIYILVIRPLRLTVVRFILIPVRRTSLIRILKKFRQTWRLTRPIKIPTVQGKCPLNRAPLFLILTQV